jgi:hypothetical protein
VIGRRSCFCVYAPFGIMISFRAKKRLGTEWDAIAAAQHFL